MDKLRKNRSNHLKFWGFFPLTGNKSVVSPRIGFQDFLMDGACEAWTLFPFTHAVTVPEALKV